VHPGSRKCLRVRLAHALPAVGQVFDLEQKQDLFGLVRVLPQVFEVHALFRMLGCVVLKLLLDGEQRSAL
jgi:hypothetical protein